MVPKMQKKTKFRKISVWIIRVKETVSFYYQRLVMEESRIFTEYLRQRIRGLQPVGINNGKLDEKSIFMKVAWRF